MFHPNLDCFGLGSCFSVQTRFKKIHSIAFSMIQGWNPRQRVAGPTTTTSLKCCKPHARSANDVRQRWSEQSEQHSITFYIGLPANYPDRRTPRLEHSWALLEVVGLGTHANILSILCCEACPASGLREVAVHDSGTEHRQRSEFNGRGWGWS